MKTVDLEEKISVEMMQNGKGSLDGSGIGRQGWDQVTNGEPNLGKEGGICITEK